MADGANVEPQEMSQETMDRLKVKGLLEQHDYDGFGDLDHLRTLPESNKARLHSKLVNQGVVEGVPFPASLAIVRAILCADLQMTERGGEGYRLSSEPDKLRFGVHHSQMAQVKEVSFSDLKRGFDRIRFQRDVTRTTVGLRYLDGGIPGSQASIHDWRGFEFYSIPAPTSNLLWDLFDMDKTTWARTESEHRQYSVFNEVGEEVPAFSPVLVAADRNLEEIETARLQGRRIPAVPMSQHGALLHMALFEGPRMTMPGAYQEMVWSHFNALGDEKFHRRPYAPGETWLVVDYEPPPRVRAVDLARFHFVGRAPDPVDPWIRSLPNSASAPSLSGATA